jgi:uncharacterized protein (TIGR02996 family)
LLAAIARDPADPLPWQALADWLEESGQVQSAELARLTLQLRLERRSRRRPTWRDRVRALLAAGVAPCVPEVVNSVGMRLVLVPPGSFVMGAPRREKGWAHDQKQHEVEITRGFWLGAFQVTQDDYEGLTGFNPSWYCPQSGGSGVVTGLDTRRFPVENVSWEECAAFCRKLSARPAEKRAGRVYRLPTEAEWEYSCRAAAGYSQAYFWGAEPSTSEANFERGQGHPCPVGSYKPNAFGLYDLHGNVYEWCGDWDDQNYYKNGPRKDPTGPADGSAKVYRGGNFASIANYVRSAYRTSCRVTSRYHGVGLRVACDVRGG